MVNVSTLVYVLENFEGKDEALINLEEILEEEEQYVEHVFCKLDQSMIQIKPGLVDNILKTASTT